LERLWPGQPADRFDEREGGADGALGIVLVRPRIAEIDEHAVAHVFGDIAVEPCDRLGDAFLIPTDDVAQILRIEPSRQRCRADQVAKHDRELAALGAGIRQYRWHCGRRVHDRIRQGRRAQLGYCSADAHAVAGNEDANVLENLIIDLPEKIRVDLVGLERIGVLGKADGLEPLAEPGHAANSASSDLACFRSSVSKPSVNQP
jgi:hypothetical protein